MGAQDVDANRKAQADFGSFFQACRQFQQPARDRELMQLSSYLSPIFEHKGDANFALQAYARGAG